MSVTIDGVWIGNFGFMDHIQIVTVSNYSAIANSDTPAVHYSKSSHSAVFTNALCFRAHVHN
jgi:hypothetical protein